MSQHTTFSRAILSSEFCWQVNYSLLQLEHFSCLSTYLSIMSIYLFVYLFTCLSICLYICLSIYLYLSIYVYYSRISLSVYRFISLSIHRSFCLSMYLSLYLYVCLSAHLIEEGYSLLCAYQPLQSCFKQLLAAIFGKCVEVNMHIYKYIFYHLIFSSYKCWALHSILPKGFYVHVSFKGLLVFPPTIISSCSHHLHHYILASLSISLSCQHIRHHRLFLLANHISLALWFSLIPSSSHHNYFLLSINFPDIHRLNNNWSAVPRRSLLCHDISLFSLKKCIRLISKCL